jgi:asparagine N-glycosylation enzyme membrane subunit Stt3
MFCTEHLYIKNSEKALGDFMIGVWLGISVFSSIVLLAISIVTILLYGKQPESRKKINMFRVLGFMLLFLLAIIIYIPMPATYADGVITGRLVGSAIAYLLLGTSFVFEFLDMKNTKLVKSRKRRK